MGGERDEGKGGKRGTRVEIRRGKRARGGELCVRMGGGG